MEKDLKGLGKIGSVLGVNKYLKTVLHACWCWSWRTHSVEINLPALSVYGHSTTGTRGLKGQPLVGEKLCAKPYPGGYIETDTYL